MWEHGISLQKFTGFFFGNSYCTKYTTLQNMVSNLIFQSTHLHMVPLALGGINVCECVKHCTGVKYVSIACRF